MSGKNRAAICLFCINFDFHFKTIEIINYGRSDSHAPYE